MDKIFGWFDQYTNTRSPSHKVCETLHKSMQWPIQKSRNGGGRNYMPKARSCQGACSPGNFEIQSPFSCNLRRILCTNLNDFIEPFSPTFPRLQTLKSLYFNTEPTQRESVGLFWIFSLLIFFLLGQQTGGAAYAGYALCWIRHCDVTPHIHIPVYLPESLYTSNQHSALTSAIGQIFIEWADPGHLQGWPLPDGRKSALFAHV